MGTVLFFCTLLVVRVVGLSVPLRLFPHPNVPARSVPRYRQTLGQYCAQHSITARRSSIQNVIPQHHTLCKYHGYHSTTYDIGTVHTTMPCTKYRTSKWRA
eukprot:689537-Rhodomonas_salina.2